LAAAGKRKFRCQAKLEREAHASGFALVAGADEAGRGSLFGPVFAAAVILSPCRPVWGLRDSKELAAGARQELALAIRARALAWAVAPVDAFLIDEINIYQASCLAMKRAIEQLEPGPDALLVDAVRVDLPLPQTPVIHGDAKCQSIAAASILAKVARDACMREWDSVYPQYGLARHKGYGTAEHLSALSSYGPSPHHRFSYEPVRASCARSLRGLFFRREAAMAVQWQ
jgi:ribonuclease HII